MQRTSTPGKRKVTPARMKPARDYWSRSNLCPHCGAVIKGTKFNLHLHMNRKHKFNLHLHMNRKHGSDLPQNKVFRCYMCDQHFYENDKLEKHVNSHTNSKPYACLVCKKTYNSNANLAHHACSQKETPYSCPIASCAKTFKTSTEAIDHQHTHDNVPAFTCLAKLKHRHSFARHLSTCKKWAEMNC
jgi:uncharacterized Zn-finger protein